MLYDLESHAKDGRCGLSRNEDIRRYLGKLVEKQTLDLIFRPMYSGQMDPTLTSLFIRLCLRVRTI